MLARFENARLIHESARAVLFRARRSSDGVSVILKAARSDFPTPEERARLRHEFEILSRLGVPGAARAIELTEGDKGPVLVLEDAGGGALRDEIGARGMDLARFFSLAPALARILAEVHRAGVVHRAVSPASVVIDERGGRPSLVGFSAARSSSEYVEAHAASLETTLEYIAPEQTGRIRRAVDWRSDLYSLGATFYEMLTGRPPVARADAPETIHAILARTPAAPHDLRPEIPPFLSAIVMKLLAKTMEDRYQGGLGLAHDLDEAARRFAAGHVAPFELGSRDAAGVFRLPQRLYGRDAELEKLRGALERVGQSGVEVLMIAGSSGVGKSSLVREIHRSNAVRRGYFVEGKFDQFQRATHSAVVRTLSDLIQQILTETEERVRPLRERLRAAVGESGALLTEALPQLELLIGPQPAVSLVASEENINRVNAISLRLIQAFTDAAHPLVMFFDDLQWADLASLELLQRLVVDADTQHLLVLGAYRDEQIDAAHPVTRALELMSAGRRPPTTLTLRPLDRSHVLALLVDALHRDEVAAAPLADMVFDKTRGNPFFVREFVTSLHETGKLSPQEGGGWTWDLGAIQAQGVTDNVAVLMTERVRRLSESTQRVLHLAACIGSRFDVQALAVVYERLMAQTLRALWPALEAGLVEPVSASRLLLRGDEGAEPAGDDIAEESSVCRFAHDRVQLAAHDLVPPEGRAAVHLRIARLMLARLTAAEREARIFEIVRHFDECLDLVDDPAERERLSELYLDAGLRANRVAATEAADAWLRRGRDLLPGDAWTRRRSLAMSLHSEGAETTRVLRRFAEMEALIAAVRAHARGPLDLLGIYETLIQHHMRQNQPGEAIVVAREILAQLGVPLPASPSQLNVATSLLWTLRMVRRIGVANLANLPEMRDPTARAAMRVMMRAGAASFISSPNLFPILACQMVKLSLRHGNSAESSWAYMLLASVVAVVLGNYDEGWSIGRFALSLMERLRARELLPKNYAAFYANQVQWKSPWRACFEPLERGQHTAVEVGDLEFACTLALIRCWSITFSGDPLDVAKRVQAECLAFIERHRYEFQAKCVRALSKLVLDLRGEPSEHVIALDDEAAIRGLVESKSFTAVFLLKLWRGVVAYLLGDPREALVRLTEAREHEAALLGTMVWSEVAYFQSLAILACWSEATAKQQITLQLNRRKLKAWAKQAPFNFEQKHLLVEAEWARVRGRGIDALQLYERAASVAKANGFIYDAALAMERAARNELDLGLSRAGWAHLHDAYRAYRSWGAIAKADALEAELAASPKGAPLSSAPGAAASPEPEASLDVSTIFDATKAISEEIVLDALLSKLIRLLIQNAGAERCLLILDRDGRLMIEAHASVTAGDDVISAAAPLDGDSRASAAIVSYVARTGESVVLDDAAAEGLFVGDPYVVAARPKSILCAPMINQQRVIAVVYLENNLTTGAFTAERLEVVSILLSQAALSIHNARLYSNLEASNRQLEGYSHTLEQKVDARTRDLRDKNEELFATLQKLRETQQQLVHQEKLASLGVLTSGIAHELRNPLNLVTNFTELSSGLVAEIADALGRDAKDDIDEAVQLLQGNLAKIGEHGRRANGIIDSMLMHSQGAASPHEMTDLNSLVAESIRFAAQALRAGERGVDVQVTDAYDPAVGLVELAPADVRRVIINLVNNAYDAMWEKRKVVGPGYAPVLTVTTRGLEDAVEVRIADNGTGVPDRIVDKIFNPFFTTKEAGRGTGLGLSISHDIIVQSHRGGLRVETTPGEGAVFVISLPRRGAEAAKGATADGP